MSELSLFIPITKVDQRQRLVYGIATAESEDRSGEICDYASTKPLYEQWSQEIAQSTGGKSRGNLRAMHGAVAAGKIIALAFNDEARQIEICAKVIDDAEWRKVEEGVYTGFSQGGTYARRWTDDAGRKRYTAAPSEISLVDLPCLPQARFEMIKADGSRVVRPFGQRIGKGLDLVAQFAELVDDLDDVQNAAALEAMKEGDGSEVPAQLKDLLQRAGAILRAMTAEETNELDAEPAISASPPFRKPAVPRSMAQIAKAGARNSAADLDRIQMMHDTSVDLGAQCGAQKAMHGTLEKRFDALSGKIDDLLLRVKNIESQPLPLPLAGRPRAVSKREDAGLRDEDNLEKLLADPDSLALLAIKMAQRNGRSVLPR
ncbi:MAG: hypothetical protein ACYC5H_12230 [Methylovirgula sp.]